MLTGAQADLTTLQSDQAEHEDTRVFRLERIAQMEAELETLSGKKREKLADKITAWTAKIDKLDGKIADAGAAIAELEALIQQLEADIAAAQAICDGSGGSGGGDSLSGLTFLHSDHLGRPKFATNANGEITWDGGITTPFGIQITALGAQTQALMFPGQYEDAETTGAGVTLSHNWHRTYDPTLGRYLQSDPIGLAGGLNRYAYVGGNPVMLVDPTGEILPLLGVVLFNVALDVIIQTQVEKKSLRCINLTSTLVAGTTSFIPGLSLKKSLDAIKAARKLEKRAKSISLGFGGDKLKDATDGFLLTANLNALTFSASLEIPKLLPEFTIGDDCECQ